jgi:hypothetical protein
MRLAGFLILCCLAVQSAFADDTNLTLTVDGITYSNVTFGSVTPSSVSIRHSTGIAAVPLDKLPPDLQQRFGYDPEKASAFRRAEAEELRKIQLLENQKANARAAANATAAAEQERAKWIELVTNGEQPQIRVISGKSYDFSQALAWFKEDNEFEKTKPAFVPYNDRTRPWYYALAMEEWNAKTQKHRQESPKWSVYVVRGKVLSVLPEGLLVDAGRTVFLRNYPKQSTAVDNDDVNALAMPAGQFSYTTVAGATATVLAYDFGVPQSNLSYQSPVPLPPLASK